MRGEALGLLASNLVVRSQDLVYGVQSQIWRDPAELFGRINGGFGSSTQLDAIC